MSPDFSAQTTTSQPPVISLAQDFASQRCWAIIGVSADRNKYGNKIFRQLLAAHYDVYAINPKLAEVEGQPCFPSLAALPVLPDVVSVVVPPQLAMDVVEACIAQGIKRLWFQPGAEEPAALMRAEAAGLQVLANACILLQHQHWPSDAAERQNG